MVTTCTSCQLHSYCKDPFFSFGFMLPKMGAEVWSFSWSKSSVNMQSALPLIKSQSASMGHYGTQLLFVVVLVVVFKITMKLAENVSFTCVSMKSYQSEGTNRIHFQQTVYTTSATEWSRAADSTCSLYHNFWHSTTHWRENSEQSKVCIIQTHKLNWY